MRSKFQKDKSKNDKYLLTLKYIMNEAKNELEKTLLDFIILKNDQNLIFKKQQTETLMNSRFIKKELINMADIVDLLAEHICE